MVIDQDQFARGNRLGDFEIVRRIGRGGMGSVYLAEDLRLRRMVALKVILPELADSLDFRRRFEAEARGAAAIEHPNIVPIYAAGSADGHLYLAMRFVDGPNLNEVLDSHGPMGSSGASQILSPVAEALDAAHSAGLVHRDVTPANILLEGELGAEGVYLTDFGLVRGLDRADTRLTRTDQVIANLDYAAPEQIEGRRIDARTDVYALGCVLYRMLSGERPFPGTDTQKMWKIVHEPVPPIGNRPSAVDSVIARATAKDPDHRYPSAGDLARAAMEPELAATARLPERSVAAGSATAGFSGAPTESEPTRPLPASGKPRPRPRPSLVTAMGIAAVLVGAVIAAILIAGGGGGSPSTVVRERTVTASSESEQQPREVDKREPSEERRSSVSAKAASGLEPFTGAVYVTEVPSDWVHDEEVVEEAPYHANLWQGTGEVGEPYVRVEGNYPAPLPDPVRAGEESRANTSQSDGYRELYYGPGELDGREGLIWEYEVDGDRRVVYGFVECSTNLAVVGSALPQYFSAYSALFDEIAAATHTRCAD